MIQSLFDSTSTPGRLKAALTGLVTRARGAQARIANAEQASTQQGSFVDALGNVRPDRPIDIEAETAILADSTLRFEAASQLLTQQYTDLRTAMRRDG